MGPIPDDRYLGMRCTSTFIALPDAGKPQVASATPPAPYSATRWLRVLLLLVEITTPPL